MWGAMVWFMAEGAPVQYLMMQPAAAAAAAAAEAGGEADAGG